MNRHKQQRLVDYLAHIQEATERIALYTGVMDESEFSKNLLVQDAVIRNLEIVGEASHNIETHCPEFAAKHPDVPWAFAYQMRNAVVHGYFKVDLSIVWQTVQRDLPQLHAQIQQLRLTLHGP